MCIVIIKRSKNSEYSYFIGLNREEKYERKYENIDNHWLEYPSISGYMDIKSNGTWFGYNQNIIAITINKEDNGYGYLDTRSHLILHALKDAKCTDDAITTLLEVDTSKIKPFNMLIISRDDIKYVTNFHNNSLGDRIAYFDIDDDLMLLNRSFPNDFDEKRIASNFNDFLLIEEPVPEKDNWSDWEKLMKKECYASNPNDEETLWLNSDEWGTLVSDIIAVPRNENIPLIIHNVKIRQ